MFDWLRRTSSFRRLLKSHPLSDTTPDAFRLEKKRYNWLLEYGELMDGFPEHNRIGVPHIHPAFTVETNYSMWVPLETGKPVALKFKHPTLGIAKAKIAGELYALTKDEIIALDIYRENGVSFHRKEVKILIPNGPDHIERRAWIYLGGKSWEDRVKWDADFYRGRNGSHFALCNTVINDDPKIKRFYHYCALDMKPRDETCYLYFHKKLNEPNSGAA